jgi:LmbE family N-acetylglucosaminyl deacetylase
MPPWPVHPWRPEPRVIGPGTIPDGKGKRILLVVAHADDAAIFAGGALILFAEAGWDIHALRLTDDRWDSVGLSEAETIRRNAGEFRAASHLLGIAATEDLGLPTDVMGDASRVALRERLIHAIRRLRPYALMGFDPDSAFYEDNLDHRIPAQALDEAFWCAMFDKHHPEHFAEGLAPHGCIDRWYFGRLPVAATHVVDTASVIDRQMQAVACHATPIANMAHQAALQARTAGWTEDRIAALTADPAAALTARLRAAAAERGAPFGLAAADWLRCHSGAIRAQDDGKGL